MNNSNRPYNKISIRTIQSSLKDISRVDSDIPRVNPDGIYGKTTAEAVYAFQNKYMGGGNGRLDFPTWQELLKRSNEARTQLSPSDALTPFELRLKDSKLIKGDKCDLVAIIKIMLQSMRITYPFFDSDDRSDTYDEQLYNAIKKFQMIHGLDPNGEIDKKTWNRLALAYNRSILAE